MAENTESGVHGDPFAPNLSVEERLRALESAYAEPASGRPGSEPHLSELKSRLEKLAAEVAAQSNRVRDQEKSMVERIADVDDDRRLTTLQLQRGWQSQRDGFAHQVQRHGRLMIVLVAITLIGSGLITYFTRSLHAAPATLVEEVAALQRAMADLRQQNGQLQEHITTLSTRLEATALPRDESESAVSDQAQGADAKALAKQLERLSIELQNQGNELDALRHTLHQSDRGAQTEPAPGAPLSQARKRTTKINDRPFALQLVGDSNRDRLLELASRSGFPETVYIYQGTRRGSPWFILVHSLYPTSAEAKSALEQIPAKQRIRTPWIRSLPKGTELEIIELKPGHH